MRNKLYDDKPIFALHGCTLLKISRFQFDYLKHNAKFNSSKKNLSLQFEDLTDSRDTTAPHGEQLTHTAGTNVLTILPANVFVWK